VATPAWRHGYETQNPARRTVSPLWDFLKYGYAGGVVEQPDWPRKSSLRLSQEISVHDPAFPAFCFAAPFFNVVPDVWQIPGDEDFVLCPDIGAPIDVDRGIPHVFERAIAVQHHHDIVDPVGQSLGKVAAGRDVNGFADAIERDFMPGRQRLNAADAGNDLIVERAGSFGRYPLNNP